MRVCLTKSTERAAGWDFGDFSTEADYLTPSWRLHQSRAISKTKSRGSQPRQYKAILIESEPGEIAKKYLLCLLAVLKNTRRFCFSFRW